MENKRKEILIVLLISLIGIGITFFRTEKLTYSHDYFQYDWDHHHYIEMALNNPFSHQTAPFGWRILNPLLARLLPFDLSINFAILSFIFLWLTSSLSYFVYKSMGYSDSLAIAGLLFFISLGNATKKNIFDFWLTDPLSFLFVLLSLWCVVNKKELLFLFVLAIGVMAKENVLFVAPMYYTMHAKKILDWRLFLKSIYLTIPAVLVLIFIRILIPHINESYNIVELFNSIGLVRLQSITLNSLYRYSLGTFGVSLMILPAFSIKENLKSLIKFMPFIVLTYLSIFFATNTERILVSAFPAIIVMALNGINFISSKTGVKEKYFILLPILLILLNLINTESFIIPPIYESIVLLLLLALLFQVDNFPRLYKSQRNVH